MTLDPVLLSRLQWAWVVSFHILLPAFTVGLAAYISVLEGLHVFTGQDIYARVSSFWIRIFAVSFGMGVVSGIIMPFQFGTNWSRFSDAASNIITPLLGYEGFMAFALESTFLGVLLFARKLVSPWIHFLAAILVALGTLLSTAWILAVNSWMQTPVGYHEVNGRFFPRDWLKIMFSPSFPYRFFHNDIAFFVTTAFVVLGVGAWLVRRQKSPDEGQLMMRMALNLLIVLVPLQILAGDLQGDNTYEYQPAKIAAIEGLWDTKAPMPWTVFAIPDQAAQKNLWELDIPHVGSMLLDHDWNGQVKGLRSWPRDEQPPMWPVFFAFRIMVLIAGLMLLLVLAGWIIRLRGRLHDTDWFLGLCTWFAPAGFIAVLMGWTTTEVGRQPWTIYGLMRTANSVTPSLTGADVLASLVLYALVYLIVFPMGVYYMSTLVRSGVTGGVEVPGAIESGRPNQPFAAGAKSATQEH